MHDVQLLLGQACRTGNDEGHSECLQLCMQESAGDGSIRDAQRWPASESIGSLRKSHPGGGDSTRGGGATGLQGCMILYPFLMLNMLTPLQVAAMSKVVSAQQTAPWRGKDNRWNCCRRWRPAHLGFSAACLADSKQGCPSTRIKAFLG